MEILLMLMLLFFVCLIASVAFDDSKSNSSSATKYIKCEEGYLYNKPKYSKKYNFDDEKREKHG